MGRPISGRARDAHGAPVAGARVMFTRAPVAVPDVAVLTDASGVFVITAPARGRYVLGCAADGFSKAEASVAVEDEPASVEFVLLPER